ncbi:hypothetical protein VKT23_016816 [Stygiomarasmius scandens]|uniref:AB hydrolase-1 domain-containing protein n=1 Tax=Marasmiellus scandens TaxID=2682957 RepID=A0ABR1IWH7_9AGAR
MPYSNFIELNVDGGSLPFRYNIATPTNPDAKTINRELPTVLFLHPVFIGQEAFIMQFNDPQLRRFNLVTLDLRGHGRTGGNVSEAYDQKMAAEYHIFALSMGTIIGLELAVNHPERVLSLFFVSPICLKEKTVVAEGRTALHDEWERGFTDGDPETTEVSADSGQGTAAQGGMELAFVDTTNNLVQAYIHHCLPQCLANWNAENLSTYKTVTLDFLVNRKPQTQEALSAIRGIPVKLIHCQNDVAYEVKDTEDFKNQLEDAGVGVTMEETEGSHFGSLEHAHLINPIFFRFLVDVELDRRFPAPAVVTSAWDIDLIKAGWEKDVGELFVDDEDDGNDNSNLLSGFRMRQREDSEGSEDEEDDEEDIEELDEAEDAKSTISDYDLKIDVWNP